MALAVIGLAVVLVARALLPADLDRAAVERNVAAEYEERIGTAVEVRCPGDMPVASGEVYPCEGTRTDGEVVYIEIQIADPGGERDYEWWTPRG